VGGWRTRRCDEHGAWANAPRSGQQNREVLRDLLGFTEEEIDGIYESGALRDEPELPDGRRARGDES
jgi:crotonobetainyl-CoA:carnitine CoA-transferase CaiB-like acyl-CoA transferase